MVQQLISFLANTDTTAAFTARSENEAEKEWFLVELQGSLELPPDADSYQNMPLGDLTLGQDGKSAFLTIGHSRLEGRRIQLDNPILLLQRQQISSIKMADVDTTQDPHKQAQGRVEYGVRCVIKYKYLFKNRPMHFVDESLRGKIRL